MLNRVALRFDRTSDVYAATKQTRLPVNLVARERAIAAAYAQVHVHHEQVRRVNDARRNLASFRDHDALISRRLRRFVVTERKRGELARNQQSGATVMVSSRMRPARAAGA